MGAALLSFVAMAALALLGRAATGGLPLSDRAQRALGWGGLGVAALLLLARQAALAATLAGLAAVLLIRAGPAPRGRAGRASTARSALLDMRLDHETGAVDGTVLAGRFEGRALSGMTLEDLLTLAAEIPPEDADSADLLRAYLDRAHPGWADAAAGSGAQPVADAGMTRAEALELLGLSEGADRAAIHAAHKRLMKRVHPDVGGSAALAAQITAARDRLLGES